MLEKVLNERYRIHNEYIFKILQEIFTSDIANYIAFKGGTLAYLCYNLDRYSTDIDLDLLNHEHEEEIKNKITSTLGRLGEIKNYTWGRDLHRWIFRYDNQSMNIKVELNKRELIGNTYENKIINGISICCMDAETMTTNKLSALGTRWYNRDLYDTYFFRKQGFSYKEDIIVNRMGMSLEKYLNFLIKNIKRNYKINSILADGMGDVLTDIQKTWVKEHLIEETIIELEKYLENPSR